MTYPDSPLGRIFQHKRLADDLSDVLPRLSMHNAVDAPLNDGAARLRESPGPLMLRVSYRAVGGAVAINGIIPWDHTIADTTGGAWNNATHTFTAPKDGVYLVATRLQASAAVAGRCSVQLNGLDTSIYPAGAFIGGIMQGVAGNDHSEIPAIPVVAKAGQQLYITVSGAAFVNRGTASDLDTSTLTIQYIGATPSGLANTLPAEPIVGEQWLDGETVSDLKLQRRFAEPMDSLQPYIGGFGQQFGLLIASIVGGGSITGQTPIPWNIDYSSGFDLSFLNPAAAQTIDIPKRPFPALAKTPGNVIQDSLWMVSVQLCSGTNAQQAQFFVPDLNGFSTTTILGTGNGQACSWSSIGRYGGKQIQVLPFAAFQPAASYRCILTAMQLG